MKWREHTNNVHMLDVPDMVVVVHRKQTFDDLSNDKRWYLTIGNGPLNFNSLPLTPIDLDDAKENAVRMIFEKSDDIRNSLQTYLKNDSKKVESFKLKLIAILDQTEELQSWFPNDSEAVFEPLLKTIKLAISDLD